MHSADLFERCRMKSSLMFHVLLVVTVHLTNHFSASLPSRDQRGRGRLELPVSA